MPERTGRAPGPAPAGRARFQDTARHPRELDAMVSEADAATLGLAVISWRIGRDVRFTSGRAWCHTRASGGVGAACPLACAHAYHTARA